MPSGSSFLRAFFLAGLTALILSTLLAPVADAAVLSDQFGAGTPIVGVTNVSASNLLATAESAEPAHAGEPATRSLWAMWTAPTTGTYTMFTSNSLNTAGRALDTVLAVYTGESLGNLTVVAANDDMDTGVLWSRVLFRAYAGEKFHIALDTVDGATGNINLRILFGGPLMEPWQVKKADGSAFSSGSVTSAVWIVDFWETICGACVDELPELVALQQSLGPRGFTLVGLSGDADPELVEIFYSNRPEPYPIAMSNDSASYALLNSPRGYSGYPTKCLVDQERRVVARFYGGHNPLAETKAYYAGIIEPLLRTPSLPRMEITRENANFRITWPAIDAGYQLETSADLLAETWPVVNSTPVLINNRYHLVVPGGQSARFYRLRKQ